ncbi:MAG: hypothetical protein WBD20_20215 [Pirellulaceae bacterium]
MRISLLVMGSLFGLFSPCAYSNGQGVQISPLGVKLTGFGQVDVEKTIEHWADSERAAITGEMNLQVELLKMVCDLDQSETDKLRGLVAVVATRRLLNGRKQLKEFIYASQLADRNPDEPAMNEEFEDKLTPYRAGKGEEGVVKIAARFDRPLNEQPLWKKVLKSSLSPQQWGKYETHCRDRNLMFVAAAVTREIADLDSKVFLDSTQSGELRSKVMEALKTHVTLDRPSSISQAEVMSQPWFGDRENLKPFLRDSQLKHLEKIEQVKSMRGVSWSR